MHIECIEKDFDKYFSRIHSLCLACGDDKREKEETVKNMSVINWKNNKRSLLYRIYVKKMFSNGNGMLTILYDGEKVVGISGVEKWEVNQDIAVLVKRLYILRRYRSNTYMDIYMLPQQVEWCRKNNIQMGMITINEYQERGVLGIVKRLIAKKSSQFLRNIERSELEKWKLYPTIENIYNTNQYFIYYFFDDKEHTKDDVDVLFKGYEDKRINHNQKRFQKRRSVYDKYWLKKNTKAVK